jgi:perosamine synthetase|tara:strand:+ start:138 stop:1235 length:1098 start_codon:yes stop_codon:yes gene_type:complete
MKNIAYSKPSIGERERTYVADAIENGWGIHCYDYIYKFQDAFKNYLGVKHAIATSSCTGALHIALKTLGVGPGDEVIVPDATWIASVAPITYLGATPVFVDVLEDTWCIDPIEIKKAITKKTKAIVAVHLYGSMCEMDEIMEIAHLNNLAVIEDAAEAIGSEYKGKLAGSIGDYGTFSFHGTKTITTGEGGMLVTNSDDLFEKACVLHDHGRDPKIKKVFWAEKIGFKYKMSNLQAALGLAQVERIDELVQKKIDIFKAYYEELKDLNQISFNHQQTYVKNSYWMPTVILDKKFDRDGLINSLKVNEIDARPFFHPVSSFPEFNLSIENNISTHLSIYGINLPSAFDLSLEDIRYICDLIKEYLK